MCPSFKNIINILSGDLQPKIFSKNKNKKHEKRRRRRKKTCKVCTCSYCMVLSGLVWF